MKRLVLVVALVAWSVGGDTAHASPQLTAVVENGQLVVRVEGLPSGAAAELRLHSDRNAAVSHSGQVSSRDPRGLAAREQAAWWYPVVDVALEPDMAALARFDAEAVGHATFNGMFHRKVLPLAPGLRIGADRLLQWENTLSVEPAAALRDFFVAAPLAAKHGAARRSLTLLSPEWRGEVELVVHDEAGAWKTTARVPIEAASPSIADPLVAWRGRGLARERLAASLQATLAFTARMQDRSPDAPTRGGLNLFYDYEARTFRRPHWVWGWGPSIKLLLDAAQGGPEVTGDLDPAELRRLAQEIGEASRRFQLDAPGDPVDGVVVSRWREAEGGLAENAGLDRFYSVADALFLMGWGWVPLYRETGDKSWLDASQRLVDATERLMGQFDIIPMDHLRPPGEWKGWTIDEAGFGPEGFAALHAATGRGRLQWLGATYMDRLAARFERPDGLWARRYEFKPARMVLTPHITRGAGWAMEGMLATHELTRDEKYLRKASRMADHLQTAQLPDGSWSMELGRPPSEVGVEEKATALWSLLFYRLHGHTRDPAHLAVARRALEWCLESQYAGPDADGRGGVPGRNWQSGVTYRAWFPLACSYTSAFFGLAVLEELKLSAP